MTLDDALLIGLSSVTGALVFVCRLLWTRIQAAEQQTVEMRVKVERMERELGEAKGRLDMYDRCHHNDCPFRPGRNPHLPFDIRGLA
jgi:hypothetical protein